MFISIFQKLLTLKNIMFLILLTLFLIFIVKEQNIAILFLGALLMGYMASNMLYQYSRINELERENKELVDRLYN